MKPASQSKRNQVMKMVLLFFFSASATFGQAQEMDMTAYIDNAAILFFIVVLITFVVLFLNVDKEGNEWGLALARAFRQLYSKLIDATPVEKEEDILLDHDYDGIKELDNNLPPWWKYLFYASIIFAVVYMLDYHIIGSGKLQEAEYLEEVKIAELEKANMFGGKIVDENSAQVLTEPADLLAGQTTFKKLCSACHGTKGEGLVGPNLTDDYWINGGGIKNVFLTIKNGVLDKGMISWKNQLTPAQMEEVGSYILSLQGTNPPNAKPPQGNLWSEKPDSLKAQ